MNYIHLDLSRFEKITREEYYITDWKITNDEARLAEVLESLAPYERHNTCHEFAKNDGNYIASAFWNLWACYFRERYIENWNGSNIEEELFTTGKQLIAFDNENQHLLFHFSNLVLNQLQNMKLDCSYFIFPSKFKINQCLEFKIINFNYSIFCNETDFNNVVFLGQNNFNFAEFNRYANFNKTTYKEQSNFKNAQFLCYGNFSNAVFEKATDFNTAFFTEDADFSGTYIKSLAFSNVNIDGDTDFSSSEIEGNAKFSSTYFNGTVFFQDFKVQNIDFKNIYIKNSSRFINSDFYGNFDFTDVIIEKAIDFSNSKFHSDNDFTGTKFNGTVNFTDCKFIKLLKISSSNFKFPPNLSFITIGEHDESLPPWPFCTSVPPQKTGDTYKYEAAELRHIKKLAKEGEDHHTETNIFRLEMLAKRGYEIKKPILIKTISAYEYVSKCGMSFCRPSLLLCFFIFIFWLLYLMLYFISGLEGVYSQYGLIKNISFDVLKYSVHNAIPIFGATVPEKTAVINALFGSYENRPTSYGVLAVIQNIICISLEFLALLAVRNYFRMK